MLKFKNFEKKYGFEGVNCCVDNSFVDVLLLVSYFLASGIIFAEYGLEILLDSLFLKTFEGFCLAERLL